MPLRYYKVLVQQGRVFDALEPASPQNIKKGGV
jgi:hypothetical protein